MILLTIEDKYILFRVFVKMNSAFRRCLNKIDVSKFWKKALRSFKGINKSNLSHERFVYNWNLALFHSCKKIRQQKLFNLYSYEIRLLNVSKNRCWKCHAVVIERDLVCMSCGCVQEPKQNLNHFEIFKETPHFDIDVGNLTVKFRRLQTLLHPDKFASRSEKEKKYSSEQSVRVNKAYQMLFHPMERGLYLLELYGNPLNEDEIEMSSDFLADVMEINEILELKKPETIESLRHVNDAKMQLLFAEVSLSFKEKNLKRARELLSKLKYYVNIDQKIRKLEDEFGITRDN